jgi:hypothetical protein
MGSAKKSNNKALSLLEGGMWRMGIATMLLVAMGIGLYIAWGRWGSPSIEVGREITADSITCTAQPPWIKSTVVEQAVQEGSLDQISIFDPKATVQVARAFEMHPWVKQVTRVSKHPPAAFSVEVSYRKPVAMVVVQTEGGTKLLPIDDESIILPTDDFLELSAEKIRSYPRIFVPGTLPQGLPGSPWGDVRVTDAARIATTVGDNWSAWGLYHLQVIDQPSKANRPQPPLYVLGNRTGGEIVWGNAPGAEVAGEPSAEQKVELLALYVEQNGSLGNLASDQVLDLRSPDLTPQVPRTARLQPVITP